MKVTNFAVISGSAELNTDGRVRVTSVARTSETGAEPVEPSKVELRSDSNFSNGKIKFKFKTDRTKVGIQIRLRSTEEGRFVYVGHAFNDEKFVVATGSKTGFQTNENSLVGSLATYDINVAHEMQVDVNGSNVRLVVDGIFLNEINAEVKENPIEVKIVTEGNCECYDFQVEKKQKQVFVVMQFSKEYDDLYEEVIRPVCSEFNLATIRADEYYSSTPIINDIINSIRESAIIVADITPDNPNVFYEIGYSHALNKPVVLLSDKKRDKLPFDVSNFRTIFYENTIAGKKKVEQSLRKHLVGLV